MRIPNIKGNLDEVSPIDWRKAEEMWATSDVVEISVVDEYWLVTDLKGLALGLKAGLGDWPDLSGECMEV